MWNPLDVNTKCLEVADFKRRVVKNVEVLGTKCVPLARQLPAIQLRLSKHRAQARALLRQLLRNHRDTSTSRRYSKRHEPNSIHLFAPKVRLHKHVSRMPLASTVCFNAPGVLVGLFPLQRLAGYRQSQRSPECVAQTHEPGMIRASIPASSTILPLVH